MQLVGAGVSIVFLAGFTWFFLKSRTGIAMRAVADNQQVAMAMGINVRRYFALAWAMAGVVSALGGVVWGAMLGVDNQLALVGLKVFPVVILGGLDSIVGAVIGGLIVGIVENFAAGYLDPYVGGGTKDFAPYVLMILVLMIRPEGMFGRRRIERVEAGAQGSSRQRMFYREAGVFKTSYAADMALFPLPQRALGGGGVRGAVHRHRAADLRRLLPVDPQSGAGRGRRRARPQHPGRLYRADLDRARRVHVGRRLYRGQSDRAASARRSGSRSRPAG